MWPNFIDKAEVVIFLVNLVNNMRWSECDSVEWHESNLTIHRYLINQGSAFIDKLLLRKNGT